jgi:hypothetical protein
MMRTYDRERMMDIVCEISHVPIRSGITRE